MDYEQKYKDALERAKDMLSYKEVRKEDMEYLFPELAESEDERIRKEIEQLIQYMHDADPRKERWLTWLEKQGNKSVNIDIESMISSYKQRLKSQGGMENSPLVNMCLTAFRHGVENALEELNLKKLEEQGKQKPADKIEPKFHEGEWITFYGGKPFKILKIEAEVNGNLDYLLLGQNGHDSFYNKKFVDENARLWTIADAKDGDVLCYENKNDFKIFIYKNGHIHYHCCYSNGHLTPVDSFFVVSKYLLCYIHPATKEQRDTLEKAMADAGYEWSCEDRKLIKME